MDALVVAPGRSSMYLVTQVVNAIDETFLLYVCAHVYMNISPAQT